MSMSYNTLGNTDLKVSEICLGTMTWGTQNTEAEGHAQIDLALDHGVNFLDTAEMYPTGPLSKETQGDTERVIGSWIAASKRRDDIIIATKVSGEGYANVRDGAPISRETITIALENSLRSMQTDYIDLYQLHWPNRGSYMFRKNWTYDPTGQNKAETLDHMAEVLSCLEDMRRQGKIRHFGLSNESSWGTAQWLRLADEQDLPRVVSIQNEYSLLCRLFDTDLAELCHNEQVGLLAFSPLACGLLSGKYEGGTTTPPGSRMSIISDLGGRITPRVWPAVNAYLAIARKYEIDPVQLAIAWTLTRSFMASSIIGAKSLDQLTTVLGAAEIELSDAILADIDLAHRAHPMPY